MLTLKSNSSANHRTFCGVSFCSLRLSPTPFLSGLRAISRAFFKNCSWDRAFEEIPLRTLSLDYVLIIAHLFGFVKGFFTLFLKVRGRERPHRDLNPVPHWLAEVNFSLPLTLTIIADFWENARWQIQQIDTPKNCCFYALLPVWGHHGYYVKLC